MLASNTFTRTHYASVELELDMHYDEMRRRASNANVQKPRT